jgi:hypothetical protein
MNCNAKRSSANIFPRAAHYMSKCRMWLASCGLVTPVIYERHSTRRNCSYPFSVCCLYCLICHQQIHSCILWTHCRMLTLSLLFLLVSLVSGRNNTDKTPWRCPEITQPPAVSCSCDLPHTLRCIGDSSALQVRRVTL